MLFQKKIRNFWNGWQEKFIRYVANIYIFYSKKRSKNNRIIYIQFKIILKKQKIYLLYHLFILSCTALIISTSAFCDSIVVSGTFINFKNYEKNSTLYFWNLRTRNV